MQVRALSLAINGDGMMNDFFDSLVQVIAMIGTVIGLIILSAIVVHGIVG